VIIDAHLHLWDLDRAEYPWLTPEIGDLYRSIAFPEIAPVLRVRGIDGAILVQASDEAADTEVMLAAADAHPQILGVVAWSPLDDPARLAADLERWAEDPRIVGVRNLIHERPPAWLERPVVDEGFAVLAAAGVPFDFVTADPAALAALPGIGARHPDLRIVLDHLGKPPIGGDAGERAEWYGLLAAAARNPLTVAKVSGLYAARGPMDSWTVDAVRPFVEDALDLFGPDRLLYGGDWPISQLAGGYPRTWLAIGEILAPLLPAERAFRSRRGPDRSGDTLALASPPLLGTIADRFDARPAVQASGERESRGGRTQRSRSSASLSPEPSKERPMTPTVAIVVGGNALAAELAR
jgi:L-fuconolactonase